jgi:hypothetical protein
MERARETIRKLTDADNKAAQEMSAAAAFLHGQMAKHPHLPVGYSRAELYDAMQALQRYYDLKMAFLNEAWAATEEVRNHGPPQTTKSAPGWWRSISDATIRKPSRTYEDDEGEGEGEGEDEEAVAQPQKSFLGSMRDAGGSVLHKAKGFLGLKPSPVFDDDEYDDEYDDVSDHDHDYGHDGHNGHTGSVGTVKHGGRQQSRRRRRCHQDYDYDNDAPPVSSSSLSGRPNPRQRA